MIENDPDEVFLEAPPSSNAFGRGVIVPGGGVTPNLSRKKATPPQPGKKLVIKLVKGKPTLPAYFEEITRATLNSAISAIFLKQPNPCDLEKLYQAVNDLCLHKMGESLYRQIEKECEAYISAALQSLVCQSEALYLDRTYVKQIPNGSSLWDMGLQLYRKHLSLALEVRIKAELAKQGLVSEAFEPNSSTHR